MLRLTLAIFWRFLILGLVGFGGPVAHIGYFQKTFVEDLKWLSLDAFSKLVAFSHILPGPGSSQVGFAIGYHKAGLLGAVTAFIGFTLPSFLLMYLIALSGFNESTSTFSGMIEGLKLFAVVVVADAIFTMSKKFSNQPTTLVITLSSALLFYFSQGLMMQIAILLFFALIGMLLIKKEAPVINQTKTSIAYFHLTIFLLLFLLLPLLTPYSEIAKLMSAFYSSGSLVFGGGHVVLPLLQETLGNAMDTDTFLAGYSAVQAMPGPMFSFASFLGAHILNETPFLGASLATLAIFTPGLLLVLAFYRSWEYYSSKPKVFGAITAINASVVGLLISAFISPVFTSAVHTMWHFSLAFIGFLLLRFLKIRIIFLLLFFALASVASHYLLH